MTKAASMQAFWNSFGIPAYEENSVPTGQAFPYITYQLVTDSFGAPVLFTASLYYREKSWLNINKKTEEISRYIGFGGVLAETDGGAIWIQRGQPFAQSAGDPADKMIKRKMLNLTAEYLTAN